jgi:ATP-dependent Clp protease adaptor protein ClpS
MRIYAGTKIETEEDLLVETLTEDGHRIILFNDDVNTFDHVIEMLVKYCEHDIIQAEQCAWIVHNNGKCDVKNGSYKELKPICEALLEGGLSAEIH